MFSNELHFSKFLTVEHVNSVKSTYGFQDGIPIEQFVMDFEAFFHIQEHIPDSVVKGGMSVPFHLPDNTARRLSRDIDIVTSMSEEQVKEAMGKVRNKLNGVITIEENYKPPNPKKNLNLLTYYPKFDSCLGGQGEIKVEITYGFKESIPVRKITESIDLFACDIDFPFNTYNIGALIGDKITTLGFSTIGIDADRFDEIPKQIYDVATLTKHTTKKEDFEYVADGFQKILNYENSIFSNQFTEEQIVNDILNSLNSLVNNREYSLDYGYASHHETFRHQLLGKNRYLKAEHVSDILIVQYLVKKIKELAEGISTKQSFANDCFTDIQEFTRIMLLIGDDRKREHNLIKAKHSIGEKIHMQRLKMLTAEQSFLYDKIIS